MPNLTNKTFLDDAGLQAIWGKITNKCATKEEFNKLKGCFYDSNYVYSTSKAYNNGDYAVYNGVLYICTDDVTAGTWAENSDSFSQITSLAVLQTLTSAFSLQAETVSGLVTDVGHIEGTISGSADEYSASKPYSAGDMVMHDGTLYKCTDDVAAGPWSTNYDSFEDTTIVGELANAGGSSGPDPMVCNSGDEYDTTKAYAVGDRVTHEGVYYKCTTACSANTWAVNSTNFTADTLVSTANDLRSSFQDGCNTIVTAVTAKGVTPSSNSPTDIATAIGNISTGKSLIVTVTGLHTGKTYLDVRVKIKYGTNEVTTTVNSSCVAAFGIDSSYTGDLVIEATDDYKYYTQKITISSNSTYTATMPLKNVYGLVIFNTGSARSSFRRILSASDKTFNSSVNGLDGSSDFDSIMPWSGMTVVDDPVVGKMVRIPKYYYRIRNIISNDILNINYSAVNMIDGTVIIEISSEPMYSFYTSYGHIDRGDGIGERDYIYLGRYLCNSSYKSQTGTSVLSQIQPINARANIHNLGNEYWMMDYLAYYTYMLLLIVENGYLLTNGIGYGGVSTDGSFDVNGATDDMPYHTGTTAASRTKYGPIQYRNIESVGSNGLCVIDGIRNLYAGKRTLPSGAVQDVYVPTINLNPINNNSFTTGINIFENLSYIEIGGGSSNPSRVNVCHKPNVGYFMMTMIGNITNSSEWSMTITNNLNSHTFCVSEGTAFDTTHLYVTGCRTASGTTNNSRWGIFYLANDQITDDNNGSNNNFNSVCYRIMKLPS